MRIGTRLAGLAAVLASLNAASALAHHAFVTEFDPDTEGKVEGVVTKVWWANPHIRYDVDMQLPDGTIEQWSLHPPGNLPTYRREDWTAETVKAGDHVVATGNLGREGTKKLYATCIVLDSGRELGRCVSPGTVSEVTADPTIDLFTPSLSRGTWKLISSPSLRFNKRVYVRTCAYITGGTSSIAFKSTMTLPSTRKSTRYAQSSFTFR